MKTKVVFIALLLFILSNLGFSQAKSFDEEISGWHKKAIMTCGMLKNMNTFDQQKFLNNLNELENELKVFMEKYLENPPVEYSKDPLWKTYLEDLMDNTIIIREKIENKQYRLAQKYCPFYCMTFGKMHRNNGKVDLTDLMFSWRAEIKNAMDMFNATNYDGAIAHLEMVEKMYLKVKSFQQKKNDKKFDELFEPLEKVSQNWIEAIKNKNIQKAIEFFNLYMSEFSKPYLYTL